MKPKKGRNLLGVQVTDDELDKVNALHVALVRAKNVPMNRSDVVREAINKVAVDMIGQRIFDS